METPFKLPLSSGVAIAEVFDADSVLVILTDTPDTCDAEALERRDYIITAVNSHADLRTALDAVHEAIGESAGSDDATLADGVRMRIADLVRERDELKVLAEGRQAGADSLRKERDECVRSHQKRNAELAALEEQVEELRAALVRHGSHAGKCIRATRPLSEYPCECGLATALCASEPKAVE